MVIQIKSPNADEIFDRFKSQHVELLKKHYSKKNIAFNIDQITSAEFVQDVVKAAVFYFQGKLEIKAAKGSKTNTEQVDADKIEKITFYEFGNTTVDKEEWKGEEIVPIFSTIKPKNCEKCGGTGQKSCEACKGASHVNCSKCSGNGQIQCQKCVGKGKLPIEIKVINSKGEKTTKTLSYNCTDCFGYGTVVCYECKGIGQVACRIHSILS